MEGAKENPGRGARLLIRRHGSAALGTLSAGMDGSPYTSLVLTATDYDGAPLLLISTLAEHTANIGADDRVSLLFSDVAQGGEDLLTQSRVSLVGRIYETNSAVHRARFLARHPEAADYADFADFAFYRVAVERAHLVAGFGRIDWVDGPDLLLEANHAGPFADAEPGIVGHMNADHRDSVALYATRLLGRCAGDWRVAGCDPDGLNLYESGGGGWARLDFDPVAAVPSDVRAILVDLARRAETP
jgi:heme iron utilization protein